MRTDVKNAAQFWNVSNEMLQWAVDALCKNNALTSITIGLLSNTLHRESSHIRAIDEWHHIDSQASKSSYLLMTLGVCLSDGT